MNFRDQFTIYFIRPAGEAGPIKIGLSADPQKRLDECRSWSPVHLELVGTVPGNWADEQFLHGCFAAEHSHGEWFHPSLNLQSAIQQVISSGSVDVLRGQMDPVSNIRSKKNRATRARRAIDAARAS